MFYTDFTHFELPENRARQRPDEYKVPDIIFKGLAVVAVFLPKTLSLNILLTRVQLVAQYGLPILWPEQRTSVTIWNVCSNEFLKLSLYVP